MLRTDDLKTKSPEFSEWQYSVWLAYVFLSAHLHIDAIRKELRDISEFCLDSWLNRDNPNYADGSAIDWSVPAQTYLIVEHVNNFFGEAPGAAEIYRKFLSALPTLLISLGAEEEIPERLRAEIEVRNAVYLRDLSTELFQAWFDIFKDSVDLPTLKLALGPDIFEAFLDEMTYCLSVGLPKSSLLSAKHIANLYRPAWLKTLFPKEKEQEG